MKHISVINFFNERYFVRKVLKRSFFFARKDLSWMNFHDFFSFYQFRIISNSFLHCRNTFFFSSIFRGKQKKSVSEWMSEWVTEFVSEWHLVIYREASASLRNGSQSIQPSPGKNSSFQLSGGMYIRVLRFFIRHKISFR